MDHSYLGETRSNNWLKPVIAILIVFLIGIGIWFVLQSRKTMVSPIPPQPSFEVIFYTPTPAATTPTSTPSATPKVKKTATPTPKPTAKFSPTPTGKSSVTTPTVSPTKKPSSTLTP